MPLAVFDCKGISAARRERIEAAVAAAGPRLAPPYEDRIAADSSRDGIWVLITGPQGFERTVAFAFDEAPATITGRVVAGDRRVQAASRVPLQIGRASCR